MVKKICFSAIKDHHVVQNLISKLEEEQDIDLILHDPFNDFFDLEQISGFLSDIDLLIVKVSNDCSIDLLHFAKIHKIPTLHDIDTVLMIKNKIALDFALRKVLDTHSKKFKKIRLPQSWNQSLRDLNKFKEWALPRLPIVIKSHYQHDKYMRFNFLVKKLEEINDFCTRYENFLNYDVYVQKFVECDGLDRKIYVVGDKVFGLLRENPIYIYLRDNPNDIDVDTIKREPFEVSSDIQDFARILGKELNLKIFGFDLIKPINQDAFHVVDLNDFPGLRGIPNIGKIMVEFIKSHLGI